eukprot:234667_1
MDTNHMLFFNLLLILSWINISSSVEELVSFGVTTREDIGASVSGGLHTITVWFNRNVYQCTKTPNTVTTHTCNAASSLLGCDSNAQIGARMLVQNPSGDGSHLRAFITTTGNGTNNVNYQIEGLCIPDSAVSTVIGLGFRNYMTNQTFLCQNGYTHFDTGCVDNDPVEVAGSCSPWAQMIHFDLSQPNVIIDNALWEDGTSVTISTDSNEACPTTCNEELLGPNDSGYRGCQDRTIGGIPCQSWTSQTPHTHTVSASNFPGMGIGDHNYCRNVDGEPTVWCYTQDPGTRWDYCLPIGAPQLVSFGVTTRADPSFQLHTITVWFNRNVYQCTKTPNTAATTYTCNAASSLLGCDSNAQIGARMLVQNPS